MCVGILNIFRANLIAILLGANSSLVSAQPSLRSLPTFDVISIHENRGEDFSVSIKTAPDGIYATNVPISTLIQLAYDLADPSYIRNLPPWARQLHFNLSAKVDDQTAAELLPLQVEERGKLLHAMLRAVLEDRLALKIQTIELQRSKYRLSKSPKGSKLTKVQGVDGATSESLEPGINRRGSMTLTEGKIVANAVDMTEFSAQLSGLLAGPVVDETGLEGRYSFTLIFRPEYKVADEKDLRPSLATALAGDLGLQLQRLPVAVSGIGIVHIEKPSAN